MTQEKLYPEMSCAKIYVELKAKTMITCKSGWYLMFFITEILIIVHFESVKVPPDRKNWENCPEIQGNQSSPAMF